MTAWEQRLDKFEMIIPFAGLIAAIFCAVLFAYLGYIVMSAEGCSATDCAQMMLSDEWDKGYVLSIVEQCKK